MPIKILGRFEVQSKWNFIWTTCFHISLKSQTGMNSFRLSCERTVRQAMLSLPKQIPVQLLLYKMATCLTQPATIFLSPKWKKAYLKQPLTNFIQQRNAKQT